MTIVNIILGVLLIVGGMYCLLTPIMTFATLGWLMGAAMIAEGVSSALTWNARRKEGLADGWTLAGAILSVILGCVVLGSGFMRLTLDTFLAYLAAFWLIFGGVTRIAASFKLRDANKQGLPVGKNWVLVLIIGIIVTIMGVVCLFHPLLAMASVGTLVGLGIVSSGCSLILSALD